MSDKKKILIVEDDADLRLGMSVRLRAEFLTSFAADGATAIQAAQKERPDLILLDLGLPAGDGFVVLQRLKAIPHLAVIPVIVISARSVEGNEAKALGLGAECMFQKPVDDEILLETIRVTLRKQG